MTTLTHLRNLTPKKRPVNPREARTIAETQAARFRQIHGLADDPHFPSQIIADQPRLRIRFSDGLDSSGLSGWNPKTKQWVIYINSDEAYARQRFTLAHEYKHIIDATTHQTNYVDFGGYSGHDQAEDACDYFAGCLLIPKHLLKTPKPQNPVR